MPSQDQQPEEAATKLPAAVASAAGSYAQTQMYGRGWRQQADKTKPDQPEAATEDTPAEQPADKDPAAAQEAPVEPEPPATTPEATEPAAQANAPAEVGDLSAEELAAAAAARATVVGEASDVPAAALGDEPAADGVALACEVEDSAAAQARLAQSQLAELLSMMPTPPDIGPVL